MRWPVSSFFVQIDQGYDTRADIQIDLLNYLVLASFGGLASFGNDVLVCLAA